MVGEPVSLYTSLEEIYLSPQAIKREKKRWNALVNTFQERHGSRPTYIVRAPGRVNVLGEHVDYSLFPVLPAALEEDILIAIRPTSSSIPTINLSNIDAQYKPSSFDLVHNDRDGWRAESNGANANAIAKGWDKYVRAALVECCEEFIPIGKDGSGGIRAMGMDMVVSGTVPPGSGLSSSAAFVVSSVLAFLVIHRLDRNTTKADVVRLSIAAEHRMGLRTGGMDQSASVLCQPHSLLHLSFFPDLQPKPLPLPDNLAIVITNSLAPHSLASCAAEHYNLRVVEVLCAARLLLNFWELDEGVKAPRRGRIWLRDVLEYKYGNKQNGLLPAVLVEDELKMLQSALKDTEVLRREGGWTRDEMIDASGMSREEFQETYLDFLDIRATHFHLYERTFHTLTESIRVAEFVKTCQALAASTDKVNNPTSKSNGHLSYSLSNGCSNGNSIININGNGCYSHSHTQRNSDGIKKLGQLMNASHECMRDIYECTHPLVDELQEICIQSGSIGSRMTGGGWGGSVVSLVQINNVEDFLKCVKREYRKYKELDDEEFGRVAFATLPGGGAGVYVVNDGNDKDRWT